MGPALCGAAQGGSTALHTYIHTYLSSGRLGEMDGGCGGYTAKTTIPQGVHETWGAIVYNTENKQLQMNEVEQIGFGRRLVPCCVVLQCTRTCPCSGRWIYSGVLLSVCLSCRVAPQWAGDGFPCKWFSQLGVPRVGPLKPVLERGRGRGRERESIMSFFFLFSVVRLDKAASTVRSAAKPLSSLTPSWLLLLPLRPSQSE